MNKHARIAKSAHGCGLHLRNWSGGGEIVFAVYESDCYLGTVQVADGKITMHKPWYKKDGVTFRALE